MLARIEGWHVGSGVAAALRPGRGNLGGLWQQAARKRRGERATFLNSAATVATARHRLPYLLRETGRHASQNVLQRP